MKKILQVFGLISTEICLKVHYFFFLQKKFYNCGALGNPFSDPLPSAARGFALRSPLIQ